VFLVLGLQVSQTITRGGPRSQIAIPAQGMIEFRDALTDLLEEFGTDDGGFKGELPEGRHMRVENKNFYFDIGQNNRGIYMRISEVNYFMGGCSNLIHNVSSCMDNSVSDVFCDLMCCVSEYVRKCLFLTDIWRKLLSPHLTCSCL